MMDNPTARISVSSLNHTLTENGTRDGLDHQRGSGLGLTISTAPLNSPTAAYPGPRPPYSSTSATLSSHSNYEYMSPPSSRRTTMDDKIAPRQSLPSITEALKGDNLPFTSAPAHSLPAPARPDASMTPGRTLPEPPPGPPNPFSQSTAADRYGVRPSPSLETLTGQDPNKSSFQSINATAPLPPSTFRSTPKSPRNAYPQYSPSYNPSPHTKDFGPPPNVSPNPRPPHQSPYSYSMNSTDTASARGPGSDQSRFSPPMKYENGRPAPRAPPTPSYGTAVKRHIDTYDAECALNQIVEYSSRAHDFARKWSGRVHQRQRNGYMPEGCLPSLPEVDDLMRQLSSVHQSFEQIRNAALVQQQVLAEEQALASKPEPRESGLVGFAHEMKTNGEFTVGDSKKRRGKAAPPGRCHSCNRAETPEWRRGPDGARTLCNACGLHYAKLTRKGVANKNASAPGSNLRPKEVGAPIPS